jgi:hypothetical protein
VLALDTYGEGKSQLVSQGAGVVVATDTFGGDNHGPQIAKVDLIDATDGCLGSVQPFCCAERGVDPFGQAEEDVGRNLRLAGLTC